MFNAKKELLDKSAILLKRVEYLFQKKEKAKSTEVKSILTRWMLDSAKELKETVTKLDVVMNCPEVKIHDAGIRRASKDDSDLPKEFLSHEEILQMCDRRDKLAKELDNKIKEVEATERDLKANCEEMDGMEWIDKREAYKRLQTNVKRLQNTVDAMKTIINAEYGKPHMLVDTFQHRNNTPAEAAQFHYEQSQRLMLEKKERFLTNQLEKAERELREHQEYVRQRDHHNWFVQQYEAAKIQSEIERGRLLATEKDKYNARYKWENSTQKRMLDYTTYLLFGGKKPIFHGGCLKCNSLEKNGIIRCMGCQYFQADWNKPDLSNYKDN